jgi:hypothetical protein
MFDQLYEETRMHPHISATIAAERYADFRATADRRRSSAGSAAPRFGRVRAAWRGRRAAPPSIGGARTA